MLKVTLITILATLSATSFAHATPRVCADLFSNGDRHELVVIPDPAQLSRDLQSFLTFDATTAAHGTFSTNDYHTYVSNKIEPYSRLFNEILKETDWQSEAAELRRLLETQHRIAQNLKPNSFQRVVLRRGLHKMDRVSIDTFISDAFRFLGGRKTVLDKIDRQEFALVKLQRILEAVQTELGTAPQAIVQSKIPESTKKPLISYLGRKAELMSAQRTMIQVQLPNIEAAKTNYFLQLAELENFLNNHVAELKYELARIAAEENAKLQPVSSDSFGDTYLRLKKSLPGITRKILKSERYDDALYDQIKVYLIEDDGRVVNSHLGELSGTKVRVGRSIYDPADLFYKNAKFLSKFPYEIGETVWVPKTGFFGPIDAIRPNGDVVVHFEREDDQVLTAQEMRDTYYTRNMPGVFHKVGQNYFTTESGAFEIYAVSRTGDVAAKADKGLIIIKAAELRNARPVK